LAYADLYERIRRKTPVPITERDLERVLTAAQVAEDLWALMDLCDVPLAALPAILGECQHEGLLEREGDRLALTERGRALLEAQGWTPPWQVRCPSCEGRGIDLQDGSLGELLKHFQRISRDRPKPRAEYDQAYMTPASTVARVALLGGRGDLVGKRLIVLGDDDLVGLAAALSGGPTQITVLEIDEELVTFIEEAKGRLGLENLDVRVHDLREPLPPELEGAYDTFVTDPPESFEGCTLFLSRGLSALKGVGSAGYFGLTRREASLAKWYRLQRWLVERGACLTDCLDDFSAYVNWPYWDRMRARRWLGIESEPKGLWYRSALIRFELIEPKAYPNQPFEGTFEDPESATTEVEEGISS